MELLEWSERAGLSAGATTIREVAWAWAWPGGFAWRGGESGRPHEAPTLEAAKRAAERWSAAHVPECAEALLREAEQALRQLLGDTQHAEHPDCPDVCPVREARAVHARLAALLGGSNG